MSPMIGTGLCYMHGGYFTFDNDRVTAVVIDGVREPICPACCKLANIGRRKRGLELLDERDSLEREQ